MSCDATQSSLCDMSSNGRCARKVVTPPSWESRFLLHFLCLSLSLCGSMATMTASMTTIEPHDSRQRANIRACLPRPRRYLRRVRRGEEHLLRQIRRQRGPLQVHVAVRGPWPRCRPRGQRAQKPMKRRAVGDREGLDLGQAHRRPLCVGRGRPHSEVRSQHAAERRDEVAGLRLVLVRSHEGMRELQAAERQTSRSCRS